MPAITKLESLPTDWNLGATVDAARPGNLFPSGVGFHAARADTENFVHSVEALIRRGIAVRPLEIVRVPKADRSTRPAADMPVTDQLIYQAIVNTIKSHVYPGLVSFTTGNGDIEYTRFEDFPLSQDNVAYVLMADAASFYEYVDHDLLSYEILGSTGDTDVTEALIQSLQEWMQAPRGLPQGPLASGPLADSYISPVARAMSRSGFRFSRYSDDFRVVAENWTGARQAQLALETAMRVAGLSLAPGKLWTPRIATYRSQLEGIRRERESTPLNWADEAATVAGYGGEEATFLEVSEDEKTTAEATTLRILDTEKGGLTNTRLLRWALPRLAFSGSTLPLQRLNLLLRRYGELTQATAAYIRVLLQLSDPDDALKAVTDWFSAASFRYPWQIGLIFHATCFSPKKSTNIARLAKLALLDGTVPWFLRAQAAISLAVHGALPPQTEFVGIYELSPDASRPDFIAAVLIGDPPWAKAFLTGVATSPLERAALHLDGADYQQWLR